MTRLYAIVFDNVSSMIAMIGKIYWLMAYHKQQSQCQSFS